MDPTAAGPTVLPWDTSAGNRFAPYTPENHSATLWIASLLGLIYVIGVLIIRLFIKRRVFGFDDAFIVGSTAIALAQFCVTYKALQNGLGKVPRDVPELESVGKLVFSSRILLMLSIYLAKVSSVFLLRRLFVRDHGGALCDISLGLTVLCGIASIFVGSVGCPSSGFFEQHCGGQTMRWAIVTGLDVVTEVVGLLLPPYMVWQLQMKTAFKLRVIAAFCFRILVILFSILHLDAWIRYSNGLPSTFLVIPTLIWQQTLLSWSLISATIPNLKAFLHSLSTNWGIDWGYSTQPYGHGTFEMSNMKRSHTGSRVEGEDPYSSQPRAPKFKTEIRTTVKERPMSGENGSVGSGGSQDLIIRKDTEWVIQSERAESRVMI